MYHACSLVSTRRRTPNVQYESGITTSFQSKTPGLWTWWRKGAAPVPKWRLTYSDLWPGQSHRSCPVVRSWGMHAEEWDLLGNLRVKSLLVINQSCNSLEPVYPHERSRPVLCNTSSCKHFCVLPFREFASMLEAAGASQWLSAGLSHAVSHAQNSYIAVGCSKSWTYFNSSGCSKSGQCMAHAVRASCNDSGCPGVIPQWPYNTICHSIDRGGGSWCCSLQNASMCFMHIQLKRWRPCCEGLIVAKLMFSVKWPILETHTHTHTCTHSCQEHILPLWRKPPTTEMLSSKQTAQNYWREPSDACKNS